MLNKTEIEIYIKELKADFIKSSDITSIYKSPSQQYNSTTGKLKSALFILRSLLDFIILKLGLFFPKFRNKRIVYTAYNFTTTVDGIVEDRIVKPLFRDNILFINHSKEIWISRINNQKVYNIGGVAKLLAVFSKESTKMMRYFYAYQKVNKWVLSSLSSKEVYLMFFYDLNSLSIIFSDYRHKLKLIEIQHGSIINYPAYTKPSPIKIIDVFYVKNKETIAFLKSYLNKHFPDVNYHLLPYPKNNTFYHSGIHILYASTVELNGIHPTFLEYLKKITLENDVNIYIRLHPREKDKRKLFEEQLLNIKANVIFDESKNWLESNLIKNLIIVSPWSSVIEDAADNGYKVIILEELGKNRFSYLIDNKNVIFADDEEKLIKSLYSFTTELDK